MKKRYWLRGGLIGLILPLIGSLIFAFIIHNPNSEFSLREEMLGVFAFITYGLLVYTIPAGILFGWLYGKMRNRSAGVPE